MLHYKRAGQGKVLVLIHGFLGSIQIFDKVMDSLEQNFDVIAIDLPGHGESPVEAESYSMVDYANAVIEVLRHEDVHEAYWLGHSMGGYITLAAMANELFNVKAAVLAYSSDLPDDAEAITKRKTQQQEIRETGAGPFIDGIIHHFLAPDAATEDILYAKEVANAAEGEGLILALEAMTLRDDQRTFVAQMTVPMLVIEGEQDKAVKPIITANTRVQKVTTNTGHLGMLEDPNAFVKAVLDFFVH
ncbi:MAG: alpha/beta fold hydrolase [Solibacillus sp.]